MSALKDRKLVLIKDEPGSYKVVNHNVYIFMSGKKWVVQEYDNFSAMLWTNRFNSFKEAKMIVAARLGL